VNPFSRIKIQATLYEGKAIVKNDQTQLDFNWATPSVDNTQQIRAPKGARIEIIGNGQLTIQKSTN